MLARAIGSHLGQIPLPEARTGEFQDLAGFDSLYKILECSLDGARVSPFATKAGRFLQ
jgi:hypothetical protein